MNRSRRVTVSVLLLLIASEVASAAPINSNTAFAPHKGESILRLQYRFVEAESDPSPMDRELETQALTGVYIYGFTEKFTGILAVPYLDKELKLANANDTRITRDTDGLGDIQTLLKYRVFTKDKPGKTHRLGVFGGLEWPTGDDDESDRLGRLPQPLQAGSGSYDPILGLVWTTQTLSWEIDADLGYQFNTEANDFQFGDVIFYNVSYQHRLWPRELPEEGVPSFVYGVVEAIGAYAAENDVNGRTDHDSGGHTVFLSPGLQWVSQRWVVEGAIQLPVIQALNGDALEADYAITLGVRFRF